MQSTLCVGSGVARIFLVGGHWGTYTVKNNCKLTVFLACKITSFGRFSIITVFFL